MSHKDKIEKMQRDLENITREIEESCNHYYHEMLEIFDAKFPIKEKTFEYKTLYERGDINVLNQTYVFKDADGNPTDYKLSYNVKGCGCKCGRVYSTRTIYQKIDADKQEDLFEEVYHETHYPPETGISLKVNPDIEKILGLE